MYLQEHLGIGRYSPGTFREEYPLEPQRYSYRPEWMMAIGRTSLVKRDYLTALVCFSMVNTTVMDRKNPALGATIQYLETILGMHHRPPLIAEEHITSSGEEEPWIYPTGELELVRNEPATALDAYIWMYLLALGGAMALAWHSAWLYGGLSLEAFKAAYEACPLDWVLLISAFIYVYLLLMVRLIRVIIDHHIAG